MPEYTYLLDTRLTPAQGNALKHVRDAVREAGMTVFLAGGAVRDLTTGSSVRDLDFSVQGNALELQAALEARGAVLWGRHEPSRTLHLWFPGSVRVEVASTRTETFPKPGQPVYSPSSIVEDLRRRDFTANAMALSLNEGSYGLLLDPLNGVADIEARQLRLANNYGFLEDPARLVRAVRLRQRLGWQWEDRTATRYENAKEAAGFDVLSPFQRGYELEEIAAEEDALPVLEALQAEGWLPQLFAGWSLDSVDRTALTDLHASRIELLMQGIAPDLTAAHLEVLTAKMPAEDRERFKNALSREGLRAQWESLDVAAREFGKQLTGKDAAQPSAAWKLFHSAPAEPILWLAHGRKTPAAEAKFKNLFTVWPEIAKQVPAATMLEMRITPELPAYSELLHALFLKQIDGELSTDEAMRAFLEPYSPPAPPPPVTLRRTRAKKADSKGKRKGSERDEDDEDDLDDDDDAPVRARREDDDEESEDVDEEVPDDAADELRALPEPQTPDKLNPRVNFDSIDLDAVLGRIASDDDEEEAGAEEGSEDAAQLGAKAEESDAPVVRGGFMTRTETGKAGLGTSPASESLGDDLSEAEAVPAQAAQPRANPSAAAGRESKPGKKADSSRTAVPSGKGKAVPAKSSPAPVKAGAGLPVQAANVKEAAKPVPAKAVPPKPAAALPKATAVARSAPAKAPAKAVPAKKPEASVAKGGNVATKAVLAKAVSGKAVPVATAPAKAGPGKAVPAKTTAAKAAPSPADGKKPTPAAAKPAKSSGTSPLKEGAGKAAAPARKR